MHIKSPELAMFGLFESSLYNFLQFSSIFFLVCVCFDHIWALFIALDYVQSTV